MPDPRVENLQHPIAQRVARRRPGCLVAALGLALALGACANTELRRQITQSQHDTGAILSIAEQLEVAGCEDPNGPALNPQLCDWAYAELRKHERNAWDFYSWREAEHKLDILAESLKPYVGPVLTWVWQTLGPIIFQHPPPAPASP